MIPTPLVAFLITWTAATGSVFALAWLLGASWIAAAMCSAVMVLPCACLAGVPVEDFEADHDGRGNS